MDPCKHEPEETFDHYQHDLDGNEVKLVSAKCAKCGIYYRIGSVTKIDDQDKKETHV